MTAGAQTPFALLDTLTSEVTYARTLSELVDALVDGHGDHQPTPEGAAAQLMLRADALASHAARAQATVIADVSITGLDEDALTVLMHDRRTEVVHFTGWSSDVPLFLLETSYFPFTPAPRPTGDAIVWLNPHTERTFIDSLSALGLVELYVRDPRDDE